MRNFTIIAVICYLLLVRGYTEESKDEMWKEWKQKFNKEYESDEEEQKRRIVWETSRTKINEFNARNESFKQALSQFADMSNEEVINTVNGLDPHYQTESTELRYTQYTSVLDRVELPESVDWRKNKIVTRVKNQGGCGSCWAFSATGSLEGQYAKKEGRLVSFSEQQLVDCSQDFGNKGCGGGLMSNAFKYWEFYEAEKEVTYPYSEVEGTCQYNDLLGITSTRDYVRIDTGDCDMLKRAVALKGPVSVGMDASQSSLHGYSHGVYRSDECSSTDLDHGVLVVGYNMADTPYWIVKNSWGSDWGDKGYFNIEMKGNMCGICTLASYPVI